MPNVGTRRVTLEHLRIARCGLLNVVNAEWNLRKITVGRAAQYLWVTSKTIAHDHSPSLWEAGYSAVAKVCTCLACRQLVGTGLPVVAIHM